MDQLPDGVGAAEVNPYAAPATAGAGAGTAGAGIPVTGFRPASSRRRLLAALIDYLGGFLLFILTAWLIMHFGLKYHIERWRSEFLREAVPAIVMWGQMLVYIAWNWGLRTRLHGASLGKAMVGLRVQSADGSPVGSAVWRRIGPDLLWIPGMVGVLMLRLYLQPEGSRVDCPLILWVAIWAVFGVKVVWVLGNCWAVLRDPWHRGWWDRYAGTVVVRAGKGSAGGDGGRVV